ncbi:TlpA disulfide reductase family protein [Mucilaginibacter sabulilitoris]|uniref:TlpA disulfide reductase family protein n=1 Tax=Mucilaginibacter sabulilitoris TaxID=1173583 RepID=A0ABZ0TRD9_9SPHI|nr:TlpA disulfide reductase family protein [Mucilaginibacter sabulilitoris]WPU94733.1 TlpA disulfide reductase family protein [Mucilaginibacter sabulilitoris]
MKNLKKKIKAVGLIWISVFTLSANAQTGFTYKINGKLQNINPMPEKMYMKVLLNGLLKKDADSTLVKNGEYTFTGELNVDEAVVVSISADGKENSTHAYSLYLDKGELNVISNGAIKNITVSGSGATAQLEHDQILKGIEKEKAELQKIVKTEDYKTNQQLQAEVLKRSRALAGKGLFDMYTFVRDNPEKRSTPFTAYALISSGLIGQPGQDTIQQRLPARLKADRLGKEIAHIQVRRDSLAKVAAARRQEEAGKVPIGIKAPDFTQFDVNNKAVSLSSFKGKYVLVDFWASWCMPCRAENPNVVKAYNKYKDKGFTVLGVSLDAQSAKTAWLKAIAADGLTWTQVSDLKGWKNEAAAQYGVSSIPQNFLIDPSGVVVGKNLRGEELNAKLATIFK